MANIHLKLTHAALDEEDKNIILRGRLDPETLEAILVDDYQREVLPLSSLSSLVDAFRNGKAVPDIDLGMRGVRCTDKNDIYTLLDPLFVIDGLQRLSAARLVRNEGVKVRLGATIHFGTTREWEVARFKTLNADRNKLSTNILLRNAKDDHPVMDLLITMCTSDRQFVMQNHVCWSQRMRRDHLITALTFGVATSTLHAHMGSLLSTTWRDIPQSLQKIVDKIGKNIFRENIRTYWELIDMCWGVRTIAIKEGASHLRQGFLMTLARVLSDHGVFWRENRLFIDKKLMHKFKVFPMADPTIRTLCSSSGTGRSMLYKYMVEHLNKGRSSRRLKGRHIIEDDPEDAEELAEA